MYHEVRRDSFALSHNAAVEPFDVVFSQHSSSVMALQSRTAQWAWEGVSTHERCTWVVLHPAILILSASPGGGCPAKLCPSLSCHQNKVLQGDSGVCRQWKKVILEMEGNPSLFPTKAWKHSLKRCKASSLVGGVIWQSGCSAGKTHWTGVRQIGLAELKHPYRLWVVFRLSFVIQFS